MKTINNKGVTLIELLVTISLIGILVGVSGDLLFTIFRSFNKTSTIVNIQEEGNAILNKIKTDAINAKSVTISPDNNSIALITDNNTITYNIISGATDADGYTYGNLTRIVDDGVNAQTENLLETDTTLGVQKYKLVISTGDGNNYSSFLLKNQSSTPKLLIVYLTVVPFNQNGTTSKDLRIEGSNATLRISIVLRGTYDRIN